MPFIYDIKKDLRFIEGMEKGKEEGKEEGILEGITRGKQEEKRTLISTYIESTFNELLPLERIASIFGVSLELVTELYKKVVEKNTK